VSFFNSFLLEHFQPRILKEDRPKQIRTALQYLIQLADIFSSSQLIEVIYHFIVGFPPIEPKFRPDSEELLRKQRSPY